MNCPECGHNLRRVEEEWDTEVWGKLHRHVHCDVESGGCGYDSWYVRQSHKDTYEPSIRAITTSISSRRGRVFASSTGETIIMKPGETSTPCGCGIKIRENLQDMVVKTAPFVRKN